jgi:hypothetical protein
LARNFKSRISRMVSLGAGYGLSPVVRVQACWLLRLYAGS